MQAVEFVVNDQRFAVDITYVQSAVRMVEITTIPDAPAYLMGIVNVRGTIVPVISLRKLLHLENKDIELSDQLLICENQGKHAALWVDAVIGNKNIEESSLIAAKEIAPQWKWIEKAWKEGTKVIFILQFEKLVSLRLEGAALS